MSAQLSEWRADFSPDQSVGTDSLYAGPTKRAIAILPNCPSQ
jgi:hypothetical protein